MTEKIPNEIEMVKEMSVDLKGNQMALCLIPQILCYIDVMCYVIICMKEQNKKLKR